MTSTSTEISTPALKQAIDNHVQGLQDYTERAGHELAARIAFLNLLSEIACKVKWTLMKKSPFVYDHHNAEEVIDFHTFLHLFGARYRFLEASNSCL